MNPLTPFASLLRPSLHASTSRLLLPPLPLFSSQSFSTSPPALASRDRRMRAKVKRDRHVKAQSERAGAVSSENVDHILGYEPVPGEKTPWDGCRLQRVLLRPEAIYSAPPVEYAAGEAPQQYLPGLAIEDQQMLFGALAYTSTSLKARRVLQNNASLRQEEDDPHAALTAAEEDKVEQMQRMLDLRNASKRGIEVVNRQRVIEEFGGVREGKGVNTGSSEVQGELPRLDGRALDD